MAKRRRLAVAALSVAAHVGILLALVRAQPDPPRLAEPRVIEVTLVTPPPPRLIEPPKPPAPEKTPAPKTTTEPARTRPPRLAVRPPRTPPPPQVAPLQAAVGPSTPNVADVSEAARVLRPLRPRAILPDLPASLETLILRALAKDPQARQQSAEELTAELRAVSRRVIVPLGEAAQTEDAFPSPFAEASLAPTLPETESLEAGAEPDRGVRLKLVRLRRRRQDGAAETSFIEAGRVCVAFSHQ